MLRYKKLTSCLLANPAREEAASAIRKNPANAPEAESAKAALGKEKVESPASAPEAESAKAASAPEAESAKAKAKKAKKAERVGKAEKARNN
jgi:hypothetical protein